MEKTTLESLFIQRRETVEQLIEEGGITNILDIISEISAIKGARHSSAVKGRQYFALSEILKKAKRISLSIDKTEL